MPQRSKMFCIICPVMEKSGKIEMARPVQKQDSTAVMGPNDLRRLFASIASIRSAPQSRLRAEPYERICYPAKTEYFLSVADTPVFCTDEKIPTPSLHHQTCTWDRRISFPCFCKHGHTGCTGTCTISVHPRQVLQDHQGNTCHITSYIPILPYREKDCPAGSDNLPGKNLI
jgi:hypothetical protein